MSLEVIRCLDTTLARAVRVVRMFLLACLRLRFQSSYTRNRAAQRMGPKDLPAESLRWLAGAP